MLIFTVVFVAASGGCVPWCVDFSLSCCVVTFFYVILGRGRQREETERERERKIERRERESKET